MLIPVILSGGSGSRLWPVSRQAYPKPFMKMADGLSLSQKTLQRAVAACDAPRVLTITGRDLYFINRDDYNNTDGNPADREFLLEPTGRNTAPAIAMAAFYLLERYGDDVSLLVLPSDHLIENQDAFNQDVKNAQALAEAGYLVTFGIPALSPETGFGYIKRGQPIAESTGWDIDAFVEKPDQETAATYVETGDYFWNSGMFCFSAREFLNNLEQYAGSLFQQSKACWEATQKDVNTIEFNKDLFSKLENISVDYAVMEKAKKRAVIAAQFAWSDMGCWHAMSELTPADQQGNQTTGDVISIECQNTYIHSDHGLVAAAGVSDLIIVNTSDAVLVTTKEKAQSVKTIVSELKLKKHRSAVFHDTVYRPWGSFTILEDASDCKVKRLVVKPGQVLSLQLHHRRSEHWTVVDGVATVRVGDDEFLLKRNESTYIPVGTKHRLENATDQDIALIEVQVGDYFGEDDIVRFEDIYGRI